MNSVVLKGKLGAGIIDNGKVNELDRRVTDTEERVAAAEESIAQNTSAIAGKANRSDVNALGERVTAAEERGLPDGGSAGDVLVRTETGSAWQSFVEDMIEEGMLPAVKIGSDILGIENDILMM